MGWDINKKITLRLRRLHAVVGLLVLLVAGGGFVGYLPDNYFEIAKNLDIFGKMMREVNSNYVDEVEPNKFVRFGIDAMLKSLDPYTDFISASEITDYRFMSTGQFGGVPVRVQQRDKIYLITEPYTQAHALADGLQAGDEILQIDNEVLEGKEVPLDHVSELLRGQPHTKVRLHLRRPGTPQPLQLEVEREEIKVRNVDYYGMLDSTTGYICLLGFTREAGQEVRHAMEALKTAHPRLNAYVLDLRENPGGLLLEAINVANLFIAKNEKVVETKGRMEEQVRTYLAPNNPLDTETPVAVLINPHSASASEIVAGVLQDLDRAVVVGRRSYGKGLVQTTRPLSYNTQIKITTARYYTPSGRCIQAVDYTHKDLEGGVVRKQDSLRATFNTRIGRPVRDAGGIDPDVLVPDLELHKVAYELRNQFIIFDFATQYRLQHAKLVGSARQFAITDALYEEFIAFCKQRGFSFTSKPELQATALQEQLKKEAYYAELAPQLDELTASIKQRAQQDIRTYRTEISQMLKEEIVSRYLYRDGEREATFDFDPDIKAALAVLHDAARYQAVLRPQLTPKH